MVDNTAIWQGDIEDTNLELKEYVKSKIDEVRTHDEKVVVCDMHITNSNFEFKIRSRPIGKMIWELRFRLKSLLPYIL